MTRHDRNQEVSWWDVQIHMKEVGKAHNGRLIVSMTADMSERTGKALCVAVQFWPKGRSADKGFLTQKWLMWPHIDFKTMPAMLLYLSLTLDYELSQRERSSEEQAHF